MLQIRPWFSVAALLLIAACAGANTAPAPQLEIELDAFSGRPNPKWLASPEHAASLSRALSSLPEAPSQPEPSHLGYRGFIIRYQSQQTRVYRGHVFVTAGGTSRTFTDSARIEEQLITDASQRGFGDIVTAPQR